MAPFLYRLGVRHGGQDESGKQPLAPAGSAMYGKPSAGELIALFAPNSTIEYREEAHSVSSQSNDREPGMRAPFPGAAFTLAGKAGKGARNLWLWKASTTGIAGTGVRIAELSGAARYRAALASIGRGPLSNGGRGMAGGRSTLSKVETAVSFTLAASYVGAVVAANWDHIKGQPAAEAPITCEACGAPVGAESPCTDEGCTAQS